MRYTDLWDTIKKKAQSTDNLLTLPTVNEVLSSTDIDDYLNNLALLDRPKWSDYLESRQHEANARGHNFAAQVNAIETGIKEALHREWPDVE